MTQDKKKFLRWVALLLLTGLLIGFRTYLMAYIVQPIILLFWLVWRVLLSVNQQIYWAILIIICGALAFRLNAGWGKSIESKKYGYTYRPPWRLAHWQNLIKAELTRSSRRGQLQMNLQDLAIRLLVQGEKGDKNRLLRQRSKRMPQDVQEYLYLLSNENDVNATDQKRFWTERYFRNPSKEKNIIDATIVWMEKELEIHHESIKD